MRKFKVEHSVTTRASRETIWSIWTKVASWPEWDAGLSACEAPGSFEVGQSFQITPKGAPSAVVATLTKVNEGQGFDDQSDLGFASIEARHELHDSDSGVVVTHTITAEVADEKSDFFAANIWPNFEAGLPHSVENLVSLAEKIETPTTASE